MSMLDIPLIMQGKLQIDVSIPTNSLAELVFPSLGHYVSLTEINEQGQQRLVWQEQTDQVYDHMSVSCLWYDVVIVVDQS